MRLITELSHQYQKEFSLEGLDICDEAIAFCQSQQMHVNQCQNILEYYPCEKFDLIIMTHVLEHFPKDQIIPVLKHFKKHLLTPNGKIYLAVPNAQSNTNCYWAYEDFTHHLLFTTGSLLYVAKMSGFETFEFLDPHCLEDLHGTKKILRQFFLSLYKFQFNFWNKITSSSFHQTSPQIFSYEIKMLLGGGG